MASSECSDDDLAVCPECGESAMDSETPCSRCQEPVEPDEQYGEDQCQTCGEHVSRRFRRVFGDNDDLVYGCQRCQTRREHFHGAAADIDADPDRVIQ